MSENMAEILEYTYEKFTFKVAADCLYSADGVWLREEGDLLFLGLSDYLQQRSGDIAFAEVAAAGTVLAAGDALADIETIKADVELPSPIACEILEVNPKLDFEAEIINEEPYAGGWLAKIKPSDWTGAAAKLLTPQAYLAHMKADIQQEVEE